MPIKYMIPELSPLPILPPPSMDDSATALHIEHCASTSIDKTTSSTIAMRILIGIVWGQKYVNKDTGECYV